MQGRLFSGLMLIFILMNSSVQAEAQSSKMPAGVSCSVPPLPKAPATCVDAKIAQKDCQSEATGLSATPTCSGISAAVQSYGSCLATSCQRQERDRVFEKNRSVSSQR